MAGNGRGRLSMFELIQDGILTPGEKLLTFDYMVRHFILVLCVWMHISVCMYVLQLWAWFDICFCSTVV